MRSNPMKLLTILLISIFLFSCNQDGSTNKISNTPVSHQRNYSAELIDIGYLKYADSSRLDSLKTELTNSFNIYDDDNFKIAHIDAEELAEFSFDFFIPTLNKILAKRDFVLSVKKLNDEDNSFDVLINGDTIRLYSQSDL